MKNLFSTIILLLSICIATSQVPDVSYAFSFSSTGDDQSNAIVADDAGNTYITGRFAGSMTIESIQLTSNGTWDVFVLKTDETGDPIWGLSFGGSGMDEGLGLTIDAQGNSYVTGFFSDSFTIGGTTLTASGTWDVFIIKINDNGIPQWATSFGGSSLNEGRGIAVDASGNIYCTGFFTGQITLGTTTLTSNGNQDVFIVKMDTHGNYVWADSFGGTANDYANAVSLDSFGNLLVLGTFSNAFTVNGTTLSSNGQTDVFTVKYDPQGVIQWAISYGGTGLDLGSFITSDSNGNSYVTGSFSNTLSLGSHTLSSSGLSDVFVGKLDAAGAFSWALSFGGNGNDFSNNIHSTTTGDLVAAGMFSGSMTIGPTTHTSNGFMDGFIAAFDFNGNPNWSMSMGSTSGDDFASAVSSDMYGNLYATGIFFETMDLGGVVLSGPQNNNVFLAKLGDNTMNINDPVHTVFYSYPNPTQGMVYFNKAYNITVSDAKGSTLKVISNSDLLDLSGQRPGIYFLQIETIATGHISNYKVVKK